MAALLRPLQPCRAVSRPVRAEGPGTAGTRPDLRQRRRRPSLTAQAAGDGPATFAADEDQGSRRVEQPAQCSRWSVATDVEDQVVPCLLRIRRLVELGVPLSDIGVARSDGDVPPEVLRQVDAQLAAEIERLSRARSDIAVILRDGVPADTPAGFESVAPRLSTADSSLIHVYTRLYDDDAMKDLRRMVETDSDPVNAEMDALPPDADEATRQSLAGRLAPVIAQNLIDYPWLTDPTAHLSTSEHVTQQTFIDAVVTFYNPAQIDVLTRASTLAHQMVRQARAAEDDASVD